MHPNELFESTETGVAVMQNQYTVEINLEPFEQRKTNVSLF